ncbi:MAG TPA: helix-turn-helix transcriptional regulator [Solirubrobacteraceae bacterium]|jgi:transcriptional regulator with XRE-family HTH domain|nr:helix-turn-helix transcriptional regulator [Solirubrobacteraceae bacterium]
MKRVRTYSPATVEAARLLGTRVRLARRERRWTLQELADRVGVTHVTMRKVERGDLTVGVGVAFEAAAVLGVPLFHEDRSRRVLEAARVDDRLAVLPQAVRKPAEVDDAF